MEHITPFPRNRSLKEQLESLFGVQTPESLEALSHEKTLVLTREFWTKERTPEFLHILETEGVLEKYERGVYKVAVMTHFSTERIPDHYFYSGGAARALLLRSLGIDTGAQPRDIDIIRIGHRNGFEKQDHVIAERFMFDDYVHGHGVKISSDEQEYLRTRDLTINELYATDSYIICTEQCLLDTIRYIVRPTESKKVEDLGSDMLTKMIRFYVSFLERYNAGILEKDVQFKIQQTFLSDFWVAVNLEKAYQQGENVATLFYQELQSLGKLPKELKSVGEVAAYLAKEIWQGPSFFRYAPVRMYDFENEMSTQNVAAQNWIAFLEDLYVDFPTHVGNGSKYKK